MNFILENTFLWEVDWRPLIKFHCLITMPGHYRGLFCWPVSGTTFRKHLMLKLQLQPNQRLFKMYWGGLQVCYAPCISLPFHWFVYFVCLSLLELKGASQSTSLKAAQMHIHIFASKDATYGNHDSINMNNQTGPCSALCAVWYARVAPVLSCFVVLACVYIRVLRSQLSLSYSQTEARRLSREKSSSPLWRVDLLLDLF